VDAVVVQVANVDEPRPAITAGPSPTDTRMSGTITAPGGDGQVGAGGWYSAPLPGSTASAVAVGSTEATASGVPVGMARVACGPDEIPADDRTDGAVGAVAQPATRAKRAIDDTAAQPSRACFRAVVIRIVPTCASRTGAIRRSRDARATGV
jgi:hypothetical protein